jgi:hypothetical protein
MILTPFDTVKRLAHMSVAHNNGAHTLETIKIGSLSMAARRCSPPPRLLGAVHL